MRLPACRPKRSSPTSCAAASTRRRTISTSIGRSGSAKSAAATPAAASTRSGDPPSALTSSRRRPGASARTVPDIAGTQTTRWHGMSTDRRQRSTAGCFGSVVFFVLRPPRGRRAALEDEATCLDERRLHGPGDPLGLAPAHAAKLRLTFRHQPCPAVETDRDAACARFVVYRVVAVRTGRVRVSLHLTLLSFSPTPVGHPELALPRYLPDCGRFLNPASGARSDPQGLESRRERRVVST